MAEQEKRIAEALRVLADLGMPRAQCNKRTALCLLALLISAAERHGRTPRVR